MSKRTRSGILRMVIAFCAGVIATLYLLVPGKVGPTILVSGEEKLQYQQLQNTGKKLQEAGDITVLYAARAKRYIQNTLNTDN